MSPDSWLLPVLFTAIIVGIPLILFVVNFTRNCWLLWMLDRHNYQGHGRTKDFADAALKQREWANGKQVTFMEPEPQLNSRVKAVDSKPICESLTRYGCKIPNCKEPHYAEVEIRRALDKRQYQYP